MTDESTVLALFLPPGFNALEAIGFQEVIGLLPGFRVLTVAERSGPVTSDGGGITLTAQAGIDDVDEAEILHVPGGRVVPLLDDERTLRWIRHLHAGTRFTTAMCVGRALLGAAGILELMTAGTRAEILRDFHTLAGART